MVQNPECLWFNIWNCLVISLQSVISLSKTSLRDVYCFLHNEDKAHFDYLYTVVVIATEREYRLILYELDKPHPQIK